MKKATLFIFSLFTIFNCIGQVTQDKLPDSMRLIITSPKLRVATQVKDIGRGGPGDEPNNVTGAENTPQPTQPPVVLPSPNSAVLANLISENVDLYTGKTSVSLPLYNLQCGTLSVPIIMQASANAHKVNDIGTSTGMGWNLNAGGTITRVMKNLPDEYTGTISSSFNFPGWGYIKLKPQRQIDIANYETGYNTEAQRLIIAKGNWNVKLKQPSEGFDLQPDDFYFNFGHYSGKFVFDPDGGINLIPQTNIKITPIFEVISGINKLTGFTVLTDNGELYEFGNYSGGTYSQAPVEETKLITRSSQIVYQYRAVTIDFDQNGNAYGTMLGGGPAIDGSDGYYLYERYPYVVGAIPGYGGNTGTNPSVACCLPSFSHTENINEMQHCSYPSTWYLRKITSAANHVINFNYSAAANINYQVDRTFNASVPEMVEAQGNLGGINMSFFKSPMPPVQDAFRGTYFLPTAHIYSETKSSIELKQRKLLSIVTSENATVNIVSTTAREDLPGDTRIDNITVLNSQSNQIKKFRFDYEVKDNHVLESPNDRMRFHFYKAQYLYYSPNGTNLQYFGMMTQYLPYHAGQSAPYNVAPLTFGYEEQSFDVPEYFRKRMFLSGIKEITNGYDLPGYLFTYDHTYKLPYRTSTEQDYFGYANDNPSKSPFSSFTPNSIMGYSATYPFWNTGVTVGVPQFGTTGYKPIIYASPLSTTAGWGGLIYGGNKTSNLARMKAGVLTRITYPTGGYKEFTYALNGNVGGWNGLNASSISEYASPASTPVVTNYDYGNFINSDVMGMNYKIVDLVEIGATSPGTVSNIWNYSSKRVNQEQSTKGSAGGYDYVEVSQANNGKVKTEFFTTLDYADVSTQVNLVSGLFPATIQPALTYNFPFPANTSMDWKRGMPKKQTIVNQAGTTLSTEEYLYPLTTTLFGQKTIPSMEVTRYQTKIYGTCIGCSGTYLDWNWTLYGKSNIISTWHPLIKKTTKTYDETGSAFAETSQEITYTKYLQASKEYLLPTLSKEGKDSRGNDKYMVTRYPLDYSFNPFVTNDFLLGISALKNKNILGAPVEQYGYRVNPAFPSSKEYLSGTLYKHSPALGIPIEQYYLKTVGGFYPFIPSTSSGNTFTYYPDYVKELETSYNPYGRILQRRKSNDITESYLWAYDGLYPVAKVKNAAPADIAYTGFEAAEKGQWTYDQTKVLSSQGITGDKYYAFDHNQALTGGIYSAGTLTPSKTYTLSFWAKNVMPVVKFIKPDGFPQYINSLIPKKVSGVWNFYETDFTNATKICVEGWTANTVVDEVKLYPTGSLMNTYTFKPLIGMSSETDPNEKITYYEYDQNNRLNVVKNEDRDIVKTVCYNYVGQAIPCPFVQCLTPTIVSVNKVVPDITVVFTTPPGCTACRITFIPFNPFSGVESPPIVQNISCGASPYTYTIGGFVKTKYKVTIETKTAACLDWVASATVISN